MHRVGTERAFSALASTIETLARLGDRPQMRQSCQRALLRYRIPADLVRKWNRRQTSMVVWRHLVERRVGQSHSRVELEKH